MSVPKGRERAPVSAASILIVEDDVDVREALADVLKDAGYVVAETGNGAEALGYLERTKTLPCVILLDLMMPVMDGYQFRIAQEKRADLAAIPIVVVSAARNGEALAEPIRPVGFLKKPVDLKQLLKMVAPFCSPKA